jgi:hypothetical protein
VALPIRLYVRDQFPGERPVRIGLRAGKELLTIETAGDGSVRVQSGEPTDADARIEGPAQMILALLTGKTGLEEAQTHGLKIAGDKKVLKRLARAAVV